MASSTGPILAVGAIAMGNEILVHHRPPDWRIAVGTAIAAGGLALVELWSPPVARGMAFLALAAVLLTRVKPDVPAPVEGFLDWSGLGKR